MTPPADGQRPVETLDARLERWLSIAEGHINDANGYKLYGGDWAALASVLRAAIADREGAS